MILRLRSNIVILVLALAGLVQMAQASEVTAFDLIKEGNKYIGVQAKDKIVQIRSEKSIGGLAPNIWFVVYYDPTATFKATEVKFGGGKMMEVKRPLRVLEPVMGKDQPLEAAKLKVDSDRALAVAMKEPLLAKLNLKATQFWLEHTDLGPAWRIRFWAAKLSKPEQMVDIGDVTVSTESGQVVKDALHPNRVD
jgi:hypothetical protein